MQAARIREVWEAPHDLFDIRLDTILYYSVDSTQSLRGTRLSDVVEDS